MNTNSALRKILFVALVAAVMTPHDAVAQNCNPKVNTSRSAQADATNNGFSPEQNLIFEQLKSLAQDLRNQFDKPEAIVAMAKIGDAIWTIDEAHARSVFQRAFEAASQPNHELSPADTKLRQQQLSLVHRRAIALNEVLRLLGKHDRSAATTLLTKYELENLKAGETARKSTAQMELMAQISLSLVEIDPEQAQRLALISLMGSEPPTPLGQILFALEKKGRALSDPIFAATVENIRRNGFPYTNALGAICNYVFFNDGRVFSSEFGSQAALIISLFNDALRFHLAEWRNNRARGGSALSDATTSLYRFLVARAVPIIQANAPSESYAFAAELQELSQGVNKQQIDETADLARLIQQQRTINDAMQSDLQKQIERADHEKDVETRDNLYRLIGTRIMRSDAQQALSFAAKIDGELVRKQTEDDIRLIMIADAIKLSNYDESHKQALKLNDLALKARALAAMATRNRPGTIGCDLELLSEAYSIIDSDRLRPEKVKVILELAKQYSNCGADRGFELLSRAVTIMNKLRGEEPEESEPMRRRAKVVTYTVVAGQELTTDTKTSLGAIDFLDIAGFVTRDLAQAENIGYQIDDRIMRTQYFVAIASEILKPSKTSVNTH